MTKCIVVVEYGNIDTTEERIYDLLCSMGHTEQLSKHAFLLATEQTVVYVRDAIKNSPYGIGSISVFSVSSPAAWRSTMADSDDIKTLLHK